MTVKILIKRLLKGDNLHKAAEMLIQARTNAMGAEGYISSETLRGCDNPNEIVVVSMWETKEDWERYRDNPARIKLEEEFSELLESPAAHSAYNLGLYA